MVLSQVQAIKRAGHPDDIANMALFLASDESQWITDAAMMVDGGLTAGGSLLADGQVPGVTTGFSGPSFADKPQNQAASFALTALPIRLL